MKSKILKTIMLASSLVFLNCGDDTAISPLPVYGEISSSSGEFQPSLSSEAQPVSVTSSESVSSGDSAEPDFDVPGSSKTVESSSSVFVPESSSDSSLQNPESSSNVVASSSSVAAPSSSSVQEAKSSSSEKKPESSSSSKAVELVKGIFLSNNGDENKDQMEVEYIERTGPDGGAILSYPKRLSETQKHGVVVWGPGGGSEPGSYGGIIRRLASHGFVVIALSSSPGDASKSIAAVDWLENKAKDSNGPLYNKLDFTKVGCSGHSMGGLESEAAVIQDKRVITAFMNNSGAFDHATAAKVDKSKSIAILYGEGGVERPNAEGDYNSVKPGMVPACLLKMTGGQGNECQNGECGWGHGSGPWGGMAATVAWMRWHLGGETERKAQFVGNSGTYIDGPIVGATGKWKGQCTNF